MTAEAPERPRDRGDLFDRLPGPVGGPAWLDAIIDSVRSPATADGLRRALDARLGTAEEREAKRRLLLPRLPSHRSLLSDLAGAITIEGGADHMVRILRAAITGGTSRELLERDLTPLLELMAAAPAPGPRTDGAGRADPRPERARPEARPEARPPAAPRAERQTAPLRDRSDPTRRSGFDPDGPFRVPERVTLFGEGLLAAPLFKDGGPERGPGPVRVPSALPGPPHNGTAEQVRAWIRGEPVFTDSLGVRAGLLSLGDPGDLMEIESEFHTDPRAALRLYKARPPLADGTADAAWCARLGRDIGRFGITHERAVEALAAALARHLSRDPERVAPLKGRGAVLIVREELAEAVCGLLDAEQDHLSDGPAETSGPPQNLMGSFSPSGNLSEGRCLDRALFLNLEASVPLGAAMRQSITEFRLAQALRANPAAPPPELDRRHERDPALPLAELSGLVPIVRIGYTDPVLV